VGYTFIFPQLLLVPNIPPVGSRKKQGRCRWLDCLTPLAKRLLQACTQASKPKACSRVMRLLERTRPLSTWVAVWRFGFRSDSSARSPGGCKDQARWLIPLVPHPRYPWLPHDGLLAEIGPSLGPKKKLVRRGFTGSGGGKPWGAKRF